MRDPETMRIALAAGFEESLAHLARSGSIDVEQARARAIHRDELEGCCLASQVPPGLEAALATGSAYDPSASA
jgi:hypothetical protein